MQRGTFVCASSPGLRLAGSGGGPGGGGARTRALKPDAARTDPSHMARELKCPICEGDLPLDGDERPGAELYCTYCGAPSVMRGSLEDEDCEAEADF